MASNNAPPFRRVLVANRGEIAVRVMRTLRELGVSPAAIYADPDRGAPHVRAADAAAHIGPAPARQSYLDIDRVIAAARRLGAEAIHPGYGFLSENADFARACDAAGIVFIGPEAASIEAMGDKIDARATMVAAGVPVVPGESGGEGGFASTEAARAAALRVGLPVMLKATAGGGGKGMRLVRDIDRFAADYEAARREAIAAFGNGNVYIEKFIERPRHVEVQVLGDGEGGAIHLFERDCSIQRRHQKVIEESPCPVLDDATRARMGQVAVQAARAVRYRGAGTVELLYGGGGDFYFLEMNTRLQVEHPITELRTGVDLVRQQVLVAAGRGLEVTQGDIVPRGVAIECRIYAEDPVRFLPRPGRITALREPAGPGVRVDSGIRAGFTVPGDYDPLLAKLCVHAADRPQAIARMRRALDEYLVAGVETNLPFHRRVLAHPAFAGGEYDTGFIDAHPEVVPAGAPPPAPRDVAAAAIALYERARARRPRAEAAAACPSPWRTSLGWRRRG